MEQFKKVLITGGAGFIGSQLVRSLGNQTEILVLDSLTYAGNRMNLAGTRIEERNFVVGSINNIDLVRQLLSSFKPEAVLNLAAESHVDRSISSSADFISTNINGVFNLLSASLEYWQKLNPEETKKFRFLQVSTDEVFGSLSFDAPAFEETNRYEPNSPYSASKASADHLVRAWNHTYQLPTLITHCSNNYGPRQYPEKLIPKTILRALSGDDIPVYGNGKNIRDWIHVEDHCEGIIRTLYKGRIGQSYAFGGECEKTNIELVQTICRLLDNKMPLKNKSYLDQIRFVNDRLGHDWRYAVNCSKAKRELGFTLKFTDFEKSLAKTVDWYLESWKGQSIKSKEVA